MEEKETGFLIKVFEPNLISKKKELVSEFILLSILFLRLKNHSFIQSLSILILLY